MSDHYFSPKPTVAHDRQIIQAVLRGRSFSFVTDAGVFSKGGIDYGSRALIESMDIPEGSRVADVGCGYGPIGLTAAFLAGPGHVTMLDMNERAVALAEENARRNGIGNVTIVFSDALQAVNGQTFDRVLTNPPIRAGKEVVYRIFEEARDMLADGGQLWVVIQKKQGAPSAFAKLESLFDEVWEQGKNKGYRILVAEKVARNGSTTDK